MSKELTVLGVAIVLVFGVVIFAALNSGYGESIYLYQDGSTPLTANWDAVYNITSGAINFGNASYIITNNGAGDLLFIDINTGSKTLAELLAGGGVSGWDGTGALFQNGTRVLTANWDQGSKNLTNIDSWFLGKLNASQILTGTLSLTYIPTMDDAHIPDVDTLSYGTSFVLAQIPSIPDSKLVESGEYLLRNGTIALTGNWDAGGNNITNIGSLFADTIYGTIENHSFDNHTDILRSLWVSPSWILGNATVTNLGTHSAMLIDHDYDTVYFEFTVPADFVSIVDSTAIYLWVYPTDTHFARRSAESMFGADEEDYNQHGETGGWGNFGGATANKLNRFNQPFQNLISDVAAGDVVSLRYSGYLTGVTYLEHYILGMEFVYTANQ